MHSIVSFALANRFLVLVLTLLGLLAIQVTLGLLLSHPTNK